MQTAAPFIAPKVLVLEDEALILMDIESTLTDAHYDVRTAMTGQDALALLDAHSFDVAILDVGLKSGNSLAVADALFKRAVPFVFSSGTNDSIPIEFSTVPIINKPFDDRDLLALVGSILAPR